MAISGGKKLILPYLDIAVRFFTWYTKAKNLSDVDALITWMNNFYIFLFLLLIFFVRTQFTIRFRPSVFPSLLLSSTKTETAARHHQLPWIDCAVGNILSSSPSTFWWTGCVWFYQKKLFIYLHFSLLFICTFTIYSYYSSISQNVFPTTHL